MDTIFMNSESSKTSKPHDLIYKLTNKLDLRIGKKVIALSNLSIYYTCRPVETGGDWGGGAAAPQIFANFYFWFFEKKSVNVKNSAKLQN